MVNVSIITKCNNNCKYCFQEGDYHERNQKLSCNDIKKILKWSLGDGRIALLGGEPTLHPDIVKIIGLCASSRPTVLFSNILGPTKVIEEILIKYPQVGWLINTTTREELKDLFETNIKLFQKHRVKVSAGLTLTLNKEDDTKFINNLIRLGREYGDIITKYRIAQATPYEEGKIDLTSFSEPIEEFCKLAELYTPWISTALDCATNCCQIPDNEIKKFIDTYKVGKIHFANTCHPIFDIMADKSIKYCSSLPEDLMPKKYYTDFKDYKECEEYLESFKQTYFQKYHNLCKEYRGGCNSTICPGACFAITEYIRKYMIKQAEKNELEKNTKKKINKTTNTKTKKITVKKAEKKIKTSAQTKKTLRKTAKKKTKTNTVKSVSKITQEV